jgi:small subunit ribosomal protein S20
LANIKSSKKDIIRSRKRRVGNMAWASKCKTVIRKARTAIASGDPTVAAELTRQACRQLDKAATKGVIHRRQAARRKSRLGRRLAAIETAAE